MRSIVASKEGEKKFTFLLAIAFVLMLVGFVGIYLDRLSFWPILSLFIGFSGSITLHVTKKVNVGTFKRLIWLVFAFLMAFFSIVFAYQLGLLLLGHAPRRRDGDSQNPLTFIAALIVTSMLTFNFYFQYRRLLPPTSNEKYSEPNGA